MPRDADGGPVSVPGSGMHVMVSGDPKSGKSWIAGLITERLLDRGYRLCVLDPEGDYLALAERPEVLAFGDRPHPAASADHTGAARAPPVQHRAQPRQAAAAGSGGVCDVGAGGTRAAPASHRHPTLDRRGRGAGRVPRGAALCGSFAAADVGTMLLITYRPSLGTSSPGSCRRAGRRASTPERLRMLEPSRAGLLIEGNGGPRWRVFTPDRGLGHRHHGRQYFDGGHVSEHAEAFWG